jgi:hypothetical protein
MVRRCGAEMWCGACAVGAVPHLWIDNGVQAGEVPRRSAEAGPLAWSAAPDQVHDSQQDHGTQERYQQR